MGGKSMNGELKEFAKNYFPDSKSDLFAMFIERNINSLKLGGFAAMITIQNWMFLGSYGKLRSTLFDVAVGTTVGRLTHKRLPAALTFI